MRGFSQFLLLLTSIGKISESLPVGFWSDMLPSLLSVLDLSVAGQYVCKCMNVCISLYSESSFLYCVSMKCMYVVMLIESVVHTYMHTYINLSRAAHTYIGWSNPSGEENM